MPIPTYTPGYPPDGSSLGQTKSTIRNNLDGTFETLATDHVNNNGQPGSQPAGYHTIIHEVTQTSVSTVNGYNQLFSGVPGTLNVDMNTTPSIPNNGDTQLYSLSSAGVLSQLTGFNNSGSSGRGLGYAWIGGILIQWGFNDTTSPINFPVTFPNECFNVQITSYATPVQFDVTGTPSPTSFTFSPSIPGGSGLYWFAIGN
jgi:hypothetical protein